MQDWELHIQEVFALAPADRAQALRQLADTWLRMAARQVPL